MFVVAPLKMPATAAASIPPSRCRPSAVATPSSTTAAASRFRAQPVTAQRSEEAGAHLEADRVHEEDEPELADELQDPLVDVHAEMAEGEAGEQHSRDPQADPPHAEAAQREAAPGDQGQDEHGARGGRSVKERLRDASPSWRLRAAVAPNATAPRPWRSNQPIDSELPGGAGHKDFGDPEQALNFLFTGPPPGSSQPPTEGGERQTTPRALPSRGCSRSETAIASATSLRNH